MKEIHILHLFPKLLSLYGEYGNVAILKKILEEHGYTVHLDQYENGEPELSSADLVYIGSGTEDNILEAVKRLLPYQSAIKDSVENGTRWLVTGNALAIFGSVIEDAQTITALNVFPYRTQVNRQRRYIGDVLAKGQTENLYVGFVNTGNVYHGIYNPVFNLMLNPSLGNDKQTAFDGIQYKNFLGTQLIGPILIKNPHFLKQICQELANQEIAISSCTNLNKAYEICLYELKKRANI